MLDCKYLEWLATLASCDIVQRVQGLVGKCARTQGALGCGNGLLLGSTMASLVKRPPEAGPVHVYSYRLHQTSNVGLQGPFLYGACR